MITDDKKSILERVNFFCAFFIWSDPSPIITTPRYFIRMIAYLYLPMRSYIWDGQAKSPSWMCRWKVASTTCSRGRPHGPTGGYDSVIMLITIIITNMIIMIVTMMVTMLCKNVEVIFQSFPKWNCMRKVFIKIHFLLFDSSLCLKVQIISCWMIYVGLYAFDDLVTQRESTPGCWWSSWW